MADRSWRMVGQMMDPWVLGLGAVRSVHQHLGHEELAEESGVPGGYQDNHTDSTG